MLWSAFGASVLLCSNLPAHAYDAPAIVIPGKAGVPVILYGTDVSYCVIEGDWGLARPGHVAPTIVSCPPVEPIPEDSGRYYYPAFGRQPGYGRREVIPPRNRRLPPPAPTYYREWGAQSDPVPASTDAPVNLPVNVDVDWRQRRPPRTANVPRRK
jgi:hypothetical protein